MRLRLIAFIGFSAAMCFGQQAGTLPAPSIPADPAGPDRFGPISLASEFLDNNYINYYANANGIFDSYAPILTNQGSPGTSTTSFGYSIGGGLSAQHRFRKGSFGLTYSGSYSQYQSGVFSSGTNQNLNLGFNERLGRRWILNYGLGAGILFYNNSYLGSQPTSATFVQANPFTPETRFVATNISMGYQFTRRLTFTVGGNLYLQRYNGPGAIGTTGGGGDLGLSYRLTARTSIGGGYSRSYFKYQRGAGEANVNSVNVNVAHQFHNNWIASGFVGITHSNVTGIVTIPAELIFGPQGAGGFVTGFYNTKANLPSFGGSVTHNLKKSSLSAGAGQGIVSGNGYYLSSKNQYLYGGYSRSYRRSNINAGINYYRLTSIANSVSQSFNGFSLGAGYSYVISPHISANFRYDYLRYGNLAPLDSIQDNRFSFGFSFSSKSIPLTYF